jgi:hypothetical protein
MDEFALSAYLRPTVEIAPCASLVGGLRWTQEVGMALNNAIATGLVAASFLVGGPFLVSTADFAEQAAIKALDTDNDGTLDLAEVTKAAESVFDRLNKDQAHDHVYSRTYWIV